jgi:hypothetical protein
MRSSRLALVFLRILPYRVLTQAMIFMMVISVKPVSGCLMIWRTTRPRLLKRPRPLEAENKLLKAQQSKASLQPNKKRKSGKDKGKGKKQKKGNRTNAEPGSERKPKYCWGRGTQHAHTSSECKLMAGDKNRFNAATRNYTDSDFCSHRSVKTIKKKGSLLLETIHPRSLLEINPS